MKESFVVSVLLGVFYFSAYAQTAKDTTNPVIDLYGYIDVYYVYDFSEPASHTRPAIFYNHNRHNEIALNHLILGAKITHIRYRAALGLQTGTYVTANYAGEPQQLAKNIYEASIGYKVYTNLWIDAGIFSSYIGYETPISFDAWNVTRPLMSENSPYYQSGIKVTYEPNDKWFFSGLLLNGWQNIGETNHNKPVGVQMQFKPNPAILLNTSLFYGKEQAATDTAIFNANKRFFVNFYGIFQISKHFGAALYLDYGSQQISRINKNSPWYAFTTIFRYQPFPKLAFSFREEFYHDKYGVFVPTATPNGFQVNNYSVNVDYFLSKQLLVRIEGRRFHAKDPFFPEKGNRMQKGNVIIASSISLKF